MLTVVEVLCKVTGMLEVGAKVFLFEVRFEIVYCPEDEGPS